MPKAGSRSIQSLARNATCSLVAVGLVLFAAVMPAAAASLPAVILAPLWLIQPTSLLSIVASRAPAGYRATAEPNALLLGIPLA